MDGGFYAKSLEETVRRNSLGWLLIVAVAGLTASCGKNAGTAATDESLIAAIQSKLYADDSTKAANIKVDVKGGVVTLSGDVPSSDVELEAMKVANSTSGIRSVNDQMKVNTAAATPPPVAPEPPPAPAVPPANQAASSSAPANAPAPAAVVPPPAAAPAVSDAGPAPEPVKKKPVSTTLPAGTRLQVRMIDGVDSKQNSVGQTFRGTLDSPLVVGSRVVVPAGAPVTVALTNASKAGRVKGTNELQLQAVSLNAGGNDYQITTDVFDQVGKAKGKQTAIRSGIGAAAGALIGGLAGGGKGAAIGAGAGGGAGFGYQFFTHGSQVKIPSESVVTFRLQAPLSVRR
jgi:hypothetical protein